MPLRFPTFNELRAMARGAVIGARMAVGPARWCELRAFFDVGGALFVGWLLLPVAMLLWLAGG